jgi:hypothetical protein
MPPDHGCKQLIQARWLTYWAFFDTEVNRDTYIAVLFLLAIAIFVLTAALTMEGWMLFQLRRTPNSAENLFKNYAHRRSSRCAKAMRIMVSALVWSSS